jgi:transcription elongation factor GreA-like protein
MNAMVVTLIDTSLRIPAIVLHLTKEMIVAHHSRATRFVMLQMHKTSISESFLEVWNVFGKDVCMDVDGEHVG